MATITPLDNYDPSSDTANAVASNITPLPADYDYKADTGKSESPTDIIGDMGKDWNKAASDYNEHAKIKDAGSGFVGLQDIEGGAANIVGDAFKGSRVADLYNLAKTGAGKAAGAFRSGAQDVADALDSSADPEAGMLKTGATNMANNYNAATGAVSDWAKANPRSAQILSAAASDIGAPYMLDAGVNAAKSGMDAFSANSMATADQLANMPKPAPAVRSQLQRNQANGVLEDNKKAPYKEFDDLGFALTPEASQNAVANLRNNLGPLDAENQKRTISALNNLEEKAQTGLTSKDIQDSQTTLGQISYESASSGKDKGLAKTVRRGLNGILTQATNDPTMLAGGAENAEDAINALKQGNAANQIYQNHSDINELLRKAHGNPNAIQSAMKEIYDNPDAMKLYDPDDQKTIELLAHPAGLNNALKAVGKAGFGGGNSDIVAWLKTFGIPTSFAVGPLTGLAVTATVGAGTAANVARSRIVNGIADGLLKNIESKSVPFKGIAQGMKDSAGEMQPMQYGPTTPSQEYEAYIKSQQPSGNTPFPKDVNAPMTSQLTPQERVQAAGNVYQRVANKPATPALDAAKARYQSATNSPAGNTLRQLSGAKAQGDMSGIFPDMSESLSREAAGQSNDEVQSLLQQGYSMQQIKQLGYKRGGRVLTPALISAINKTAKRTRNGRKVA